METSDSNQQTTLVAHEDLSKLSEAATLNTAPVEEAAGVIQNVMLAEHLQTKAGEAVAKVAQDIEAITPEIRKTEEQIEMALQDETKAREEAKQMELEVRGVTAEISKAKSEMAIAEGDGLSAEIGVSKALRELVSEEREAKQKIEDDSDQKIAEVEQKKTEQFEKIKAGLDKNLNKILAGQKRAPVDEDMLAIFNQNVEDVQQGQDVLDTGTEFVADPSKAAEVRQATEAAVSQAEKGRDLTKGAIREDLVSKMVGEASAKYDQQIEVINQQRGQKLDALNVDFDHKRTKIKKDGDGKVQEANNRYDRNNARSRELEEKKNGMVTVMEAKLQEAEESTQNRRTLEQEADVLRGRLQEAETVIAENRRILNQAVETMREMNEKGVGVKESLDQFEDVLDNQIADLEASKTEIQGKIVKGLLEKYNYLSGQEKLFKEAVDALYAKTAEELAQEAEERFGVNIREGQEIKVEGYTGEEAARRVVDAMKLIEDRLEEAKKYRTTDMERFAVYIQAEFDNLRVQRRVARQELDDTYQEASDRLTEVMKTVTFVQESADATLSESAETPIQKAKKLLSVATNFIGNILR